MKCTTGDKSFHPVTACLLALLLLFGATPALSQDDSRIFTSFGVAVDVRAPSAAQARERALIEAETRAFRMLVYKLAGEEAYARLPAQSAEDIRSIVQSLEVVEERSSATRYIATFNIAFIPHRIRELFGLARVRFSELGSEPILVLPILSYAGGRSIGGAGNPWWQAWQAADLDNRLYNYVLPEDQPDIHISARLADLEYDPESLNRLASKFAASDILIVRSSMDAPTARARQNIAASFELVSRPDSRERIRIRARQGESYQDAMIRLANVYLDRADARWRARTMLTFGESFSLQVRLSFQNIGDWAKVRAALLRTPIIREVTVDWLALPVSAITLRYVGGTDQLRLSLDQEGLALVQNAEDEWWIVPAETQTAERDVGEVRQ